MKRETSKIPKLVCCIASILTASTVYLGCESDDSDDSTGETTGEVETAVDTYTGDIVWNEDGSLGV